MPSGKTARPNITDNKDGTITVRYAPTEKGLHHMGIKYDGNHIPGKSGRAERSPLGLHSCLPSFNNYSLSTSCMQTPCQPLGSQTSISQAPTTDREAAGTDREPWWAQEAPVRTVDSLSVSFRKPPAVLCGRHQ